MIADNLPLHNLSATDRMKLLTRADSAGIQVEVGTRGLVTENIEKYLEIATEFHSPILRVVIDLEGFKPSPEEIVCTLKSLLPLLKSKDIILAIENHDRFYSQTLASIMRSIDSKHIGICLDTVNSFGTIEGPETVIRTLGPFVVNLHLKDFCIERIYHNMGFVIKGTPAGCGRLNIPNLL